MTTQQEVENYISKKAKEHETADDEWEYEEIELASYRVVMKFCVGKGFTLEGIDFDKFFDDIDDEDEDEDFNCWGYFGQILELIEQMDANNELPDYVKHLHNFWQKSLWPDIYGDN